MKNHKKFKDLLKDPMTMLIALSVLVLYLLCVDTYKRAHEKEPIRIARSIEEKIIEEDNEEIEEREFTKGNPVKSTPKAQPLAKNIVVFNPNSLKFHKEYCEWAIKCKRCIKIPKEEAEKQGGVPCKVCGGKK